MLYQVLQEASSQNPEIMKPAEVKLATWESQPGFYVALLVSELHYANIL